MGNLGVLNEIIHVKYLACCLALRTLQMFIIISINQYFTHRMKVGQIIVMYHHFEDVWTIGIMLETGFVGR